MVAINDLMQVNQLYGEHRQIDQVIELFESGGRISTMTVTKLPDFVGMMVNTNFITYPPAMVESIKTQLRSRQQEIVKELSELGITDAPELQRTR